MALHDWISIPPLNDIPALRKNHSIPGLIFATMMSTGLVLIPLAITIAYRKYDPFPLYPAALLELFYMMLTYETLKAWWFPYFFGSTSAYKEKFAKFKNTHTFLPRRGDNVRPNTLHVFLHLQIWACLIYSLYLVIHAFNAVSKL